LGSIEVPASVETICRNCFTDCSMLQTVCIAGDSRLLRVDELAFRRCKKLRSLFIPGSCEFIDGSAFCGSSITEIEISVDNCHFRTWDSFLVDVSRLWIVRYFGDDPTITIPNSVETTGGSCFEWGSRIPLVTSESTLTIREVGWSAFESCGSLITICVPSSVEVIGGCCFASCHHLCEVTFGSDSHLVRIESCAFDSCSSLISICIPASVRAIGRFCFCGCSSLKDLMFERDCEAMRLYRMACRCPLVGRALLWTLTQPRSRLRSFALLLMGFFTFSIVVLCIYLVFEFGAPKIR
jgi:hypothetical protein